MIKAINNNRYFKFFQPKLFYFNQDIDNDDPKTAEIMAKVLLFAQDDKIKDVFILEQIK